MWAYLRVWQKYLKKLYIFVRSKERQFSFCKKEKKLTIMKVEISTSQLESLQQMLEAASKVVITTHMSADGDAFGSSMAWAELLRSLGKQVDLVFPDRFTCNLSFLPGYNSIYNNEDNPEGCRKLLMEADLVCCLDFNATHRVGRLSDTLLETKAKKLLIDHHEQPDEFCDLIISEPKISSTCELVYNVILALGLQSKITPLIATFLYTGLVTDTGNFAFSNADADTLETGAALIRLGADKVMVWEHAVNATSLSALRLCSYALGEKMLCFPEAGLAVVSLNADELKRFEYRKGDTEGLVNKPLSVPQIYWSVFVRQDTDAEKSGRWKVSMRSQGTFDVNELCRDYFGGGGHVNAAGGDFYGTEQAVIDKIIEVKDCITKRKTEEK